MASDYPTLCETCGTGFYLPSGVCDHCDQPKPALAPTQPTAEGAGIRVLSVSDFARRAGWCDEHGMVR